MMLRLAFLSTVGSETMSSLLLGTLTRRGVLLGSSGVASFDAMSDFEGAAVDDGKEADESSHVLPFATKSICWSTRAETRDESRVDRASMMLGESARLYLLGDPSRVIRLTCVFAEADTKADEKI